MHYVTNTIHATQLWHQAIFDKKYRSGNSEIFFKIGVFINFAIFAGKQLCWCLFLMKFNKRLSGNSIKKRI